MSLVSSQALGKVAERYLAYTTALQLRFNEEWQRGANERTILVLIIGGFVLLAVYIKIVAPPAEFPLGELVEVPSGIALPQVADVLEEKKVVRSEIALRLLVTMMGRAGRVRAGDYLFKEPNNLFSVARAITTGRYGLEPERIRILEGATVREMGKILGMQLLRVDEESFYEKAKGYEGYLFPDTYFFLPNATEETVIDTMRQNFDTHLKDVQAEIDAFGKPLEEVMILASILEREAHTTKDRQMIAGVLWNRLKRDMPLQVDATFFYTHGKGTFDLTLDDLKSDSPYNTYVHKGLPPTPIGSPSIDSIRAAVTPSQHKYLYYLADKQGVTHYSATFEEHVRKKRLYLGA